MSSLLQEQLKNTLAKESPKEAIEFMTISGETGIY
jgi:hypothetical protein